MEQGQHSQPHAPQHAAASAEEMRKGWYDRWYKALLLIPLIVLAVCVVYLVMFYRLHGDIMLKDVSLSGGTTITLRGVTLESEALEQQLAEQVPDVGVRTITELRTGKRLAVIVESGTEPEKLQAAIEEALGTRLTKEDATVEFTGPTLSLTFYRQLMGALVFSFVLICIVIFVLFRAWVPSLAVVFSIVGDIIIPLTLVNIMGVKLSAAGIAAFLMLIGYSVDTNILLTTRVLKKREGSVNERIAGAFKTGMLMTATGLLAVAPAFFVVTGLPDTFRQIFLVLALGLVSDILTTWIANASMIKWYVNSRRMV